MPRFFMAASSIGRGVAVITGRDADHARVLRLRIGDELIICDGEGTDHLCRVRDIGPGQVKTEIIESVPSPGEPTVHVTMLCALPKGERADYIVQKCTECGAAEIIFFLSRRCVARPDDKSMEKKLTRCRRIAEEAAKQAGRGVIPVVAAVPTIVEALDIAMKVDLPLFLYETGERVSLRQAITSADRPKNAAIITGPEGGFEPFEADMAAKLGIPLCSMGPRILRCETAPVAALTALMLETGNMD